MTEWHADRALLDRYTSGAVTAVLAASVEAHLITCEACRAVVAESTDLGRLEQVWAEVVDAVDRPQPSALERMLSAVGVPSRIGRLLATTPSLRLSWLVAVAMTLAVAVLAAARQETDAVFLVIAPVVPVLAVAAAYGAVDPVDELVASSPTGRFELLLLRSTAVLAVTVALGLVAAVFLPSGAAAAAWLLPALALTSLCVAASSFVDPMKAAGALVALWLLVAVGAPGWAARPGGIGRAVAESMAFRPTGQLACAAAFAAAAAVVAARRDAFDLRRS